MNIFLEGTLIHTLGKSCTRKHLFSLLCHDSVFKLEMARASTFAARPAWSK